jgi:hypothetical protein
MPRRVSLPGADELFRATSSPVFEEPDPAERTEAAGKSPAGTATATAPPETNGSPGRAEPSPGVRATQRRRRVEGDRGPSGRERHEEKITVYCSPDELFDLEHARLALRGEHGLAVDRGRIVRESVAVVLADLEAKGESSILVRRLRGR